ncbi:MAG: sigma 54-interacting transcriptional regulator [Sandaracinaceae bacterium]|nr:sigma 54-interacting transcriptional regulator [Sandaracinaceae bacterium]
MKKPRIWPLLGPATVLYLVADVASSSHGLDAAGLLVACVALLTSLAPLFMQQRIDDRGHARVGLLGVALGIALIGVLQPSALSFGMEFARTFGVAAVGALVCDIALTVPDVPRAYTVAWYRPAIWATAGIAWICGLIAVLPELELFGATWIVPSSVARVPAFVALAQIVLSLSLRLSRKRLGSTPENVAAGAWGLLGLWPSFVLCGAAFVAVSFFGVKLQDAWTRTALALSAIFMLLGHLWLVDVTRRVTADRAARQASVAVVSLIAVALMVALLQRFVPRGRFELFAFVVATLLVAGAIQRFLAPLVRYVMAPFHGRLLDGLALAQKNLASSATLEEVARAVLGPLRDACSDPAAEPLLFVFTPERAARIDAAGEPHLSNRTLSPRIMAQLAAQPGRIVATAPVFADAVRRPDMRPLLESLNALGALCIVPLVSSGELEGVLVVPAGARQTAVTLEELLALESLGRALSSIVASLSAKARAEARASQAVESASRAKEELDIAKDELIRLRADARVLTRGPAADRLASPPIAYSPAMRALMERVAAVAPLQAPLVLVGEPASGADTIAHAIHTASAVADGSFVVADCASIHPEHAHAALFGEDSKDVGAHPGWLRLAGNGTLFLVDVPALPRLVQQKLADALALKQASPVGDSSTYNVTARIIATSRISLAPLVEADAFDAALSHWLTPLTLVVPPLRERREDLASTVLLAIDRACRVLGRDVLGIEKAALDRLLNHEWPGNLRELQSVVDRAVATATGQQVTVKDIPALAEETPSVEDPLDGTYDMLERRILEQALLRASGNKSEAARALGLKRTTFLDKLRRYQLDTAAPKGNEGPN